ncbi:hypothetical protein [Thauera humireducens]|uniref:hypothetical protein n=1 Tax=Thauera humireducens TaxID=1134435 RepID=UPI00311E66C9
MVEPDIGAGMLARVPVEPLLSFGPVGICQRRDVPLSRAAEGLVAVLRGIPKVGYRFRAEVVSLSSHNRR